MGKYLFGTDVINNKQNRYLPSDIYQGANSNPTRQGFRGNQALSSTWLNENTLSYSKTANQQTPSLNVVESVIRSGHLKQKMPLLRPKDSLTD